MVGTAPRAAYPRANSSCCMQAACLQAVPLWRVRLKHMARILRHYRGRFNTIVAFRPCGWAHHTGAPPTRPFQAQHLRTCFIHTC